MQSKFRCKYLYSFGIIHFPCNRYKTYIYHQLDALFNNIISLLRHVSAIDIFHFQGVGRVSSFNKQAFTSLVTYRIHYSTTTEERFIISRCMQANNSNKEQYKFLYNFYLYYLLTSYDEILIVLFYNVSL